MYKYVPLLYSYSVAYQLLSLSLAKSVQGKHISSTLLVLCKFFGKAKSLVLSWSDGARYETDLSANHSIRQNFLLSGILRVLLIKECISKCISPRDKKNSLILSSTNIIKSNELL